ncbi:MAG: flagellar hook protein FlgE [Planctomycetes bacterium]|nr:flagellar hook protein FlgE [Planctomycetota bacterium]
MTIPSLFSSASGLRAHQRFLDVTGNNLANVNTTGFKAQRFRFSTQFSTVLRSASAPTGDLGGINPIQFGTGTQVAAVDTILAQGTLETSDSPLDLAIQGGGFFAVDDGQQIVYTRAGAFSVDAQNRLVDSATGALVQRTGTIGTGTATAPPFQIGGGNNISLPFGVTIPGRATTDVTFAGNLDADAQGPLAEVLTSAQPFSVGGAAATAATQLNALDQNTVDHVAGDTIEITGTTVAGAAVNATFTFATGNETLADLAAAITAAFVGGGPGGATASIDANGNIVLTADETGPAQLSLNLANGVANTGQTTFAGFQTTVDGREGDTASTAIVVFDDQGASHTLSFTFQKVADNVWDLVSAIDPSGSFVGFDNLATGITFNEDGSFAGAFGTGLGDPNITFEINNLAGFNTTQNITFNFGMVGGFDGLTQFGGFQNVAAIEQNGFSPGGLVEVGVQANGIVNGIFDNGRTEQLAQIAVATFRNPGGLERLADNVFRETSNSGPAQIGVAGTGSAGVIQGGTLESSNVDVAVEFTRLIIAQRGFQINARAFTTADEVLQEVANLKR